jgi:hypothetical protein
MRCVILEHVSERRSGPDRILVAQLGGTARRHSRWHALTGEEEAAAVAELREVAGGRADLLAEVVGVEVGFAQEWDEPRAAQAADLCRLAGADEKLIPRWIEVGRERRAHANMPPFSGGLHSGRGRLRPGGMPPG